MKFTFALISIFFSVHTIAQISNQEKIPILIRCDDIGMCHSVNVAVEQVLKTGDPVSLSVMVPCPWFAEAVEMLKKYKNVAIGIHLTLNSEWKQYRWGPVAGAGAVPSLVDSLGLFFPSRSALFANKPSLAEIEIELRAQINKAIRAGLNITYLDYHMGAAVQTPETRAIVEKLAAEYKLGISRYFDEQEVSGGYFATPAQKLDTMLFKLRTLEPGGIKLFVVHVGLDSPEMAAMEDANPWGPKEMSKYRYAELNAVIDPKFRQQLHESKYRLVNYKILIEEKGLGSMKAPTN